MIKFDQMNPGRLSGQNQIVLWIEKRNNHFGNVNQSLYTTTNVKIINDGGLKISFRN